MLTALSAWSDMYLSGLLAHDADEPPEFYGQRSFPDREPGTNKSTFLYWWFSADPFGMWREPTFIEKDS